MKNYEHKFVKICTYIKKNYAKSVSPTMLLPFTIGLPEEFVMDAF